MLPHHIKHSKTMIWSHIILFNLLNLLQVLNLADNWYLKRRNLSQKKVGSFENLLWLLFCLLVQLLIAKVIVMFSKPSNTISANEIWRCVKSYQIGYIRTRSEADATWNEMLNDQRLTEQPKDEISFYSDAEMELNKSFIASFMKEWKPLIEQEIFSPIQEESYN